MSVLLQTLERPSMQIEAVLIAVAALLRQPANFQAAQAELSKPGALAILTGYDEEGIEEAILQKLTRIMNAPGLTAEV